MAFISGSKGKGARRFPGRDGGRRRGHRSDWSKQARHATESTDDLTPPLVTLQYEGKWGGSAANNIYKFDQLMSKLGTRYFAEYNGRWRGFAITVSKEHEQDTRKIIAALQPHSE